MGIRPRPLAFFKISEGKKIMGRIFYDITQTLHPEILIYPGDPAVRIEKSSSIARGNIVNLSSISMGSHNGTHVDAPKHFYDQGLTIDKLPLEHLIGPAKVFEFKQEMSISRANLQTCPIQAGDIILLKTRNSALLNRAEFSPDFTYLELDAAEYLTGFPIRTFGFDYLTIDPYDSKDFSAHYRLLGQNIVIIEGLNLSQITPGEYQMVALPLKLRDGDGSPARVILIREENC
jgi:arylformamidase